MSPTLYYICFIPPKTGGELVNVQSVIALNQMGVRAVGLVNPEARIDPQALEAGFIHEHLAPGRQFRADDVIVIPEYYREAFQHFATQPCQRVIHTQGPFLTFRGFDSIEALNAHGFLAGISCSRFGQRLMEEMGATLPWHVVTPFVHPLFHQTHALKRMQVAWMPNKRPGEAPVIQALFRQRYPEFREVEWVPIVGMSRKECARVMAESTVFASLSHLEGLGLPPLEAMAAGCLVCGFTGHGGSDYATPENGLWVKEGDHAGFADAVARSLNWADSFGREAILQKAAGQATAARYSRSRFEEELQTAWRIILGDRWPTYQQEGVALPRVALRT
ncbi:MAG: glycosyltransferase [Magnetococcus sp. YQC-9]